MAGILLNRNRQVPAEETPAFGGIAERFRRAGDLDRAIALCRDGLKRFPNQLSARVTLGWALLDKGQYDAARAELETVLRKAPDNLAAIRGLAELHDRTEGAMPPDDTGWANDDASTAGTAAEPAAAEADGGPSASAAALAPDLAPIPVTFSGETAEVVQTAEAAVAAVGGVTEGVDQSLIELEDPAAVSLRAAAEPADGSAAESVEAFEVELQSQVDAAMEAGEPEGWVETPASAFASPEVAEPPAPISPAPLEQTFDAADGIAPSAMSPDASFDAAAPGGAVLEGDEPSADEFVPPAFEDAVPEDFGTLNAEADLSAFAALTAEANPLDDDGTFTLDAGDFEAPPGATSTPELQAAPEPLDDIDVIAGQELADAIKALEAATRRIDAHVAPQPLKTEPAASTGEIGAIEFGASDLTPTDERVFDWPVVQDGSLNLGADELSELAIDTDASTIEEPPSGDLPDHWADDARTAAADSDPAVEVSPDFAAVSEAEPAVESFDEPANIGAPQLDEVIEVAADAALSSDLDEPELVPLDTTAAADSADLGWSPADDATPTDTGRVGAPEAFEGAGATFGIELVEDVLLVGDEGLAETAPPAADTEALAFETDDFALSADFALTPEEHVLDAAQADDDATDDIQSARSVDVWTGDLFELPADRDLPVVEEAESSAFATGESPLELEAERLDEFASAPESAGAVLTDREDVATVLPAAPDAADEVVVAAEPLDDRGDSAAVDEISAVAEISPLDDRSAVAEISAADDMLAVVEISDVAVESSVIDPPSAEAERADPIATPPASVEAAVDAGSSLEVATPAVPVAAADTQASAADAVAGRADEADEVTAVAEEVGDLPLAALVGFEAPVVPVLPITPVVESSARTNLPPAHGPEPAASGALPRIDTPLAPPPAAASPTHDFGLPPLANVPAAPTDEPPVIYTYDAPVAGTTASSTLEQEMAAIFGRRRGSALGGTEQRTTPSRRSALPALERFLRQVQARQLELRG